MSPGRVWLCAALLLVVGVVSGVHGHRSRTVTHKCRSPRGGFGTCQPLKACGLTNNYAIVLRAIQTRLCYWRHGQPYYCCPGPARDVSSQRRFLYGFSRGRPSTVNTAQTATTAAPLIVTLTSVATSAPTTKSTARPSTTAPTTPSTVRTTSSTIRPPPPTAASASSDVPDRQPRTGAGAGAMPVPSKRLRPPLPAVVAIDVDLVEEEEEEEEVPMEEKDMPTVEPFPMEHKEEEFKADAADPGDVESICGRSDPVVVADAQWAAILREAYPEVSPEFAVPGGAFGKEARVTGGYASVQGRWPWMVMIGKRESSNVTWLCGGSIIDEYHVLTAAHCVLERPNVVRVGDYNIELDFNSGDNSEQHEIAKITLHPKYRPPRSYHDLAIVTLRKALLFSRFVRPICLPPPDLRLRRGMTAKITGHGYQEFNGGTLTAQLQEAQIRVVRRKICNASYSRLGRAFFEKYPSGVLSHMICAGDEKGGVDACQGDSGGPLVQHDDVSGAYHQIGVISSGFGCGNPEYPGLYVSVKHHLNFIRAVASSHWSRASVDPTEPIRPRSARNVAPPAAARQT